ncbi:copper chaperone PCu(A)C [Oceaniglobus roseus]|uniref:copper chaperone PCu(A)C n=1 Tax=Oceaniglobus roseus TaxID=1737570 RepID=UPI001FE666FA|nr:copper chaperone PCu(A)C [Kandeliimicrobium roseum]
MTMIRMKPAVLALLLAAPFAAAPALAHEYTVGSLTVNHPMATATSPVAKTGAGYLTITNTGTEDDALVEVRADFPKVMMHASESKDGVATMIHQERVAIPAGETVTFAPGGLHVMFMGLKGGLEEGAKIPATLVFEKAGTLDVTFNVEAAGERKMEGMDHSGHSAPTN